MLNMKNILAAASLAVISAAGIGSVSAQPYGDRWDNNRYERRYDHRDTWRQDRFDDRFAPHVNRWRVAETLRFRGLRMAGEPTFFHGRMVVRAHDRFGRPVIVHLDRRGLDVVRVIRL